jgi:hypothetical protein
MTANKAEVQLANSKDSTSVEQALEALGRMLGFRSRRWPSQGGAPDGLWWIDDWCGFVFEAKYGATNTEASLDDLRQAVSHPAFVQHEQVVPSSLPIHVVLCSDHTRVHRDAKGLATDVSQFDLQELRSLFSGAALALERLRSRTADLTDEAARAEAWRIYEERDVTPDRVLARLRARSLSALP